MYLEDGALPEDSKQARELVLMHPQFTMVDGVLYHVEPDKTLQVVPPASDRRTLFDTAHSGKFSGHLREAKIHGQLSKHYWWPKMRADITRWCRECLMCASRHVGRSVRPPLTPIPVAGPFDRVGVDIIQYPKSTNGNRYAVVFIDFLTKWPEVFPTADQSAATIARLLVEQIVCRHGVPAELLSDRGAAFLSKLLNEVYQLMGMRKINTTAYHSQLDGLVEQFNRTLTNMLAKTVQRHGADWDERLPYVLYAYRASLQESTRESPFFLLYGRDPKLPTEAVLTPPIDRELVELDYYKSVMIVGMAEAWKLSQAHICQAEKRQKGQHDHHANNAKFSIGDRVFVYMPGEKRGKAHKFALPFHGPHRVLALYNNGADVQLVGKPGAGVIRVALNRVRQCPREIPDPVSEHPDPPVDSIPEPPPAMNTEETTSLFPTPTASCWQGRLRRRT